MTGFVFVMDFSVLFVFFRVSTLVQFPNSQIFFKKRLSVILIREMPHFPFLNLKLIFFKKDKHLGTSKLL